MFSDVDIRFKELFVEFDLLTARCCQKAVWNSTTMVSGEQSVTTCLMTTPLQSPVAC